MTPASVHVERVTARYRVPPGGSERQRLDGVLGRVLGEALEPALAPLDRDDEHICIRRVDAPVRLALTERSDAALAAEWAETIAAAVSDRVQAGDPDVVRYGSGRHALLDMALGVAAGATERAWAWRALGLWPAGADEPARALVRALVADGPAVAPVLAGLARAGHLGGLGAALAPAAWLELARAALCGAGASPAVADRALGAGGVEDAVPAAVRRALGRSDIAAGLCRTGAPAVAVAALALVEADPASVGALGERLAGALPGRLPADPEPPADPAPPEDPPGLPSRPRGASAFGGLVFALHAVAALDLPARLAAELPAVARRSALHAVALALAPPAESGDPAALAFAGLPPDGAPPEPVPDDARAVVDAAAGDVTGWLAGRLRRGPEELDLDGLLRRTAEVVADPGWIEFHLRTDEIHTAVRAAGLDLDPDHLPFLGCVVRIVYA